jgi:hypothetical protein
VVGGLVVVMALPKFTHFLILSHLKIKVPPIPFFMIHHLGKHYTENDQPQRIFEG